MTTCPAHCNLTDAQRIDFRLLNVCEFRQLYSAIFTVHMPSDTRYWSHTDIRMHHCSIHLKSWHTWMWYNTETVTTQIVHTSTSLTTNSMILHLTKCSIQSNGNSFKSIIHHWYGMVYGHTVDSMRWKLKGLWEADRVGLEKGTKMETRTSL